ncbi:MAG: hypothetical protein U0W24_00340 [Bacteroidales bacterium]
MSIKYKIFPEQNLLVDVVKENVNLSDLMLLYKHEINNENFKYVYKVLSDISGAVFNITLNDILKFIESMISPNPDPAFRWAILTRNPQQTALSYIIKDHKYFSKILNVFSTLEACIAFLEVKFDENDFNDKDYLVLNEDEKN